MTDRNVDFHVWREMSPGHAWLHIFAGAEGQTFANCGRLCFDPLEAEEFLKRLQPTKVEDR